jgi:hypothetical protein
MTDTAIKDTIIHEIAHALCPNQGHNRIWKRKYIELGGNGDRCGGSNKYVGGASGRDYIMSNVSKYTLTCPDCNYTVYMNRKPKRKYSCGKHGGVFDPKYIFIISQNY